MPAPAGQLGQKRRCQRWRFSSAVGAANCWSRTWRESSRATRRLIAPPLPEASRPSSSTHSGGSSPSPVSPPSCGRRRATGGCAASIFSASYSRLGSQRQVRLTQRAHGGSLQCPVRGSASSAPRQARLPQARGGGPSALARARRLPRVDPPPPGRRAVRVLRGSADRQRRPGSTTSSPARSRTSSRATRPCAGTTSSARAAGTATACRSRSRSSRSSGSTPRSDIERYGIAEFNAKCRESVFEYPRGLGPADRADRLLGRPRPSVPDARHEVHRVGLVGAEDDVGQRPLYEGHKVVPYCARCGTALSSHEVSEGYQDVEDPASTSPSRSSTAPARCSAGDRILAWTTTPWTLLSNAALAVRRTSPTCAPRTAT